MFIMMNGTRIDPSRHVADLEAGPCSTANKRVGWVERKARRIACGCCDGFRDYLTNTSSPAIDQLTGGGLVTFGAVVAFYFRPAIVAYWRVDLFFDQIDAGGQAGDFGAKTKPVLLVWEPRRGEFARNRGQPP